MKYLKPQIIVLMSAVAVALGYLGIAATSLLVDPSSVSANEAPSGTFVRKSMGHTDYVWNWDFTETGSNVNNMSNKVDWGMRFIFKNNADVELVKDRLDGVMLDPRIHPSLPSWVGATQYAHIDDGHEHVGSYWDGDKGFKNNALCRWNHGHMRVYANYDVNYNATLGYYVVATIHQDFEGISCDNEFMSYESDEDWWVDRIRDNLGTSTDYDWVVTDNATNWRNNVSGYKKIGDVHWYQSDGWGPEVFIPNDDD